MLDTSQVSAAILLPVNTIRVSPVPLKRCVINNKPVLITGAAGNMGRMLQTRLHRPLRLNDVAVDSGCDVIASVTDIDAMRGAMRGVYAVVHLAAITEEAPWDEIVDVNIKDLSVFG
jgi:FlaA1/EpsC-like NDP-sugar epimerase